MCKELKRLIDLSECPHISKTTRDAVIWAIQKVSPDKPETETSWDGWNFKKWPSVPDKRIFNDLIKSRRAKRGCIMTQTYIDKIAPHLHTLAKKGLTVNESLAPAVVGGWTGFNPEHVLNEIGKTEVASKLEINGIEDVLPAIKSGQLTNIKQLDKEYRKMIESGYRFGKYKSETMKMLEDIGLVI